MSEPTTADKGIGAMQKAEVTLGNTGLQLRNIDELFRFAQAVAGSSLAPKDFINRPESVLVAIQMGMEVGLPPMAALQNIAVINGRPSIWGDAQLAIVRGTGFLEAFEETETNNTIEPIFRELCFEDDKEKRKALKIKIAMAQANIDKNAEDYGVSCFVRRRGFNEAFSRFTISDAKTAGLWRKQGPWTNYPSRMLKSRARSFLLRDQFGDALKGMMSREEAGDIIDITGVTSEVPRAEATPGPVPVKAPFRRPGKTVATEGASPEHAPAGFVESEPTTEITRRIDGDDGDLDPVKTLEPGERVVVPMHERASSGGTTIDSAKDTFYDRNQVTPEKLQEMVAADAKWKEVAPDPTSSAPGSAPVAETNLKSSTPTSVLLKDSQCPAAQPVVPMTTKVAPDPQEAAVSAPAVTAAAPIVTNPSEAQTDTGSARTASKIKAKEFVLPPSRLEPGWLPFIGPEDPALVKKSVYEWLSGEEIKLEEFLTWTQARGLSKPKQGIDDLAVGKLISILKQREAVRATVLESR